MPERRFQHLAESMPQLVWTATADGAVDYYNSRIARYAGADRQPDGTWQWAPMLHPDDVEPTVSAWEAAIATGESYGIEHRVRMVDGTLRWHLSRAECVEDPGSGTVRWFGTATDIHDGKLAEQGLAEVVARLRLLQEVTAALTAPLWTEEEVGEVLIRQGLLPAGASAGAVSVRRDDGWFHLLAAGGFGGPIDPRWHRFPDAEGNPLGDAIRTGSIITLAGPESAERMYPAAARDLLSSGHRSWAVVPFPSTLGVVGGMYVAYDEVHELTVEDRAALRTVAELGAQALLRARAFRREHEIATALQHAMLGRTDAVDGLAIGALYQASVAGLDIGGDWFDVVDRGDGTVVLIIGDVVGHGLDAATAMGQLRSAARAIARMCDSPEALLAELERYAGSVPYARHSTVLVVCMEVDSGRFRYLSAGHPPPLVVAADGTSTFLEGARNGPLGGYARHEAPAVEGVLEAGATLVLFTDGLVERRNRPLDAGLDRLAEVAAELRHLPPESLVIRAAAALGDEGESEDDVAVLAVRRPPAGSFRARFDADPAAVAGVRSSVRSWLVDRGIGQEDREDLLLLVGEAIGNAVEHAYVDREPGPVEVRLGVVGDEVRLTVVDHGGWRDPPAPGNRGRGTLIMRGVADRLSVDRSGGGTTLHAVRRVASRGEAS